MREIKRVIDIKKKNYNEIFLKQMDTTKLIFTIVDDSVIMNLNNLTANIIFLKSDRTVVIQNSNIEIDTENGIITVTLLKDCVRLAGKSEIEIELIDTTNNVVSSFIIPAVVEKSNKNEIQSDNTQNYIEQMRATIDKLKQDSDKLLETILKEKTDLISSIESEYQNIVADVNQIIANYDNIVANVNTQVENKVAAEMNNYELKQNVYYVTLSQELEDNSEITIPANYKVDNNSLEAYFEGSLMKKNENYLEVGEQGSISNKIQIKDWGSNLNSGYTFTFKIKGVY